VALPPICVNRDPLLLVGNFLSYMIRLHAIFYYLGDIREGFNSESYSSSSACEISNARD